MLSRGALGALVRDHLEAHGVPLASPAAPGAPTTLDDLGPFGALLALVHAALDAFRPPPDAAAFRLARGALVGADPAWLERLYVHLPDARQVMVAWWEAARAGLRATGGDDVGMCHGEAYPATCRRRPDGTLAVAELDWVGEGSRLYDLATVRWAVQVHRADEADGAFDEFLAGYAAVRPLPSIEGLSAWVAARHLFSLRLAAGFADDAGLARRAAFAGAWTI